MKKQLVALLLATVCAGALAVVAQDPLFVSARADARVMLVASRDHQLFIKAYTDYSDLDGDGVLDTTFTPHIQYDGYFDPRKCYAYENGRFAAKASPEPQALTYTVGGVEYTRPVHACASQWSGNLLNWATMTRVDVLRKVLYGGYRSTDSEGETVLERAHLPRDVHSFAKVFNAGSAEVMQKFTPYTDAALSFCNLTDDAAGTASKDSTNPPVMQVAAGEFRLWAAQGLTQCGSLRAAIDLANPAEPIGTRPQSYAQFNVRVKVCDEAADSLDGPGPRCKTYPKQTAKKPIGFLQQYGDADAPIGLRFGLMTGSWSRNKSGGVLRKNVGALSNSSGKYPNGYDCTRAGEGFEANSADEVDFCTGVFVNNQGKARYAAAADALPGSGGIIGTFNRLRIAGWTGTRHAFNCNAAGVTSFADGSCIDWGNPISEIYLESLRYLQAGNATNKLAGDTSAAAATPAFAASEAGFLPGLPQPTWRDPIPAVEWCAKSNIVMISTGINSFDGDATAHSLSGWDQTTAQLTQKVGELEGLSGSVVIGSAAGASTFESICSPKALADLANAAGVCPEMPSGAGSYHAAGLAYGTSLYDLRPGYAAKRAALWGAGSASALRQPLKTHAIALAESLPKFTVAVDGKDVSFIPLCQAKTVAMTSTPAAYDAIRSSMNLGTSGWRACSMVDLEVEPGTGPTKGSFKIVWEDSSWGSDYDMDGVVHLRYCVGQACAPYAGSNGMPVSPDANKLYIKVAWMTAAGQHALKAGYVISGTTTDGTVANVLRRGSWEAKNNYRIYDPASESAVPASTLDWSTPEWVGYSVASGSDSSNPAQLHNPLWYAAAYSAGSDWKATNNARSPDDPDPMPANFFPVRNPAGLQTALESVITGSLGSASSFSTVSANASRFDNGITAIYQARFNATDWSGQLLAYPLQTVTSGGSTVVQQGNVLWDAGATARFPTAENRRIYTMNRSAGQTEARGIAFRWSALSAKQKAALDSAAPADDSPVLKFLRGHRDGEGAIYRRRSSLLGDIVNSDPVFVGTQNFLYNRMPAVVGSTTYLSFLDSRYVTVNDQRQPKRPMLLVNANDGMMHAVDAKNGNEIFAYVPSWLVCADETAETGCASGADSSPLRDLLSLNMRHRYLLDGNLTVGDAYILTPEDVRANTAAASWKTVVVGAAAAGGKGVFALDLTKTFASGNATSADSSVADTQAAFAGATAAATVMWEFTDKLQGATGDADLGYTFGTPLIARMADGNWAAIFANGYGSANGKAVLYIVKLADGGVIKKIEVGDGSTIASPNGLSSPAAIFNSSAGSVTVVYAGDLKGNIWKFDLSHQNPDQWKLVDGGSNSPFFTAYDDTGRRQPITASLDIGAHPQGGSLIYFGTGKYFETGDESQPQQQTLYGIWDRETAQDDQIASIATQAQKRLVLQEHRILAEGQGPQLADADASGNPRYAAGGFRVTDDTASVDWTLKRGWYLNIGGTTGERVISEPIIRNKRVIFTTVIPSNVSCEFGGSSWIMEFDAVSGGRPAYSVFDLDGNSRINQRDAILVAIDGGNVKVSPNGIQPTVGMIKKPAVISAGELEYKVVSGTKGEVAVIAEPGATPRPRAAWRQIQ